MNKCSMSPWALVQQNGGGKAVQASHHRSMSLDSDLGVEVQKPSPQAALSRTPKRITVAKEAPTQPCKLSAVPPVRGPNALCPVQQGNSTIVSAFTTCRVLGLIMHNSPRPGKMCLHFLLGEDADSFSEGIY